MTMVSKNTNLKIKQHAKPMTTIQLLGTPTGFALAEAAATLLDTIPTEPAFPFRLEYILADQQMVLHWPPEYWFPSHPQEEIWSLSLTFSFG